MSGRSARCTEWRVVDALAPLILDTVEGCVVDIGMGYTTWLLLKHSKAFNRKHYSCDKHEARADPVIYKEVTHENHIIHHMRSDNFMKTFDEPAAIVLLDGCHHLGVVTAEAEFFIPKLSPGGVMFMHDTAISESSHDKKAAKGRFPDTYKVRYMLEKRDDIDIITWRYGCGISVVYKKDPDLPAYRW
tara:strand:+ start:4345 stop:4908 length:564 start_codon:yes stop_codon:yes gene_type:complete